MEEYKREYYPNGNIRSEEHFKDGKYHREHLPAKICYYENGNIKFELYYNNGKSHREDGPAYIYYYESGKIEHKIYYLNDVQYTQRYIIDNWEEFCRV